MFYMDNLSGINLNESLTGNLVLNSSLNDSANFSFVSFKSEIVTEVLSEFNMFESWFYLFFMSVFIFLTYSIFKESKKINMFIGSDNLAAFSKSFYFYFLVSFVYFAYFALIIFNNYVTLSVDFNFWSILFYFICFVFFVWIARTYLLFSILLRYYESKLKSAGSRKLFLFLMSGLILLDFTLSVIFIIISEYLYLIYNFILFGSFFYLVSKGWNLKKILKQVPYLTIILLLLLKFITSFDFFFENLFSVTYFDFIMDIFNFLIYLYIYYKLVSWRKKFER